MRFGLVIEGLRVRSWLTAVPQVVANLERVSPDLTVYVVPLHASKIPPAIAQTVIN